MKGNALLPSILLGIVTLSATSQANVVISNLNGNDGTQSASLNAGRKKAMSFFVDASSGYTVESVTVRLNVLDTATVPILTLHEDSGSDKPATIIGTFTNPGSFVSGIDNYTFAGAFAVQASTKYWIQLSGVGSDWDFDWMAASPSVAPTGVWTHGSGRFTQDGGQSWDTSSILNSYEIKASAVPEPGTMVALGLGLLAVARKRKRA